MLLTLGLKQGFIPQTAMLIPVDPQLSKQPNSHPQI